MRNIALFFGLITIVFLIIIAMNNISMQKSYTYSYIVNKFKNHEVVKYDMNLGSGDMEIVLKDGNTINYSTPSVNLIYSDIKDYVDEYDKQNPESPMEYNLIKASETSWIMNLYSPIFYCLHYF